MNDYFRFKLFKNRYELARRLKNYGPEPFYKSFSIKYLEEKLNEYFISNHLNVNLKNIISFLKMNRDKKIKNEIKIY